MPKRGAGEVPDITWAYYSLVTHTMAEFPGMYGLDERRKKYHEKLCARYRISEEASKVVTDNLDKYPDAVAVHKALKKISEEEI